ncbi:MAG: hypothetical protein E7035_09000 [Verrucomicrobiaceae bacterium]|nr:hypothetical protein [Verrucomicrobiaceae bacterium]
MKKLLLILWIFFTSLVYGKSGTVSVPLYVYLDTNIAIPTKAKIITTRIPVYQNITNIEKELKSFPQIKNSITSIFTALQSQNLDKLKDCHRPQDANLAKDLLQRFTAKGLDVNTVKILDIFFLDNKTIQFFYEIMHNKTGTKRVAYFTLQKDTNNGVFYRVKKSPTPLESLFSYSVLQHHHLHLKKIQKYHYH